MKRLIVRSSCGEALSRERTSQPACGSACRASSIKPRRVAVAVDVVGQLDPIGPAHEAARLDQLRGAKPGFADQESRAESEAAGEFVGLAIVEAADLKGRAADIDAIAELQIEPGQQRLIGGGAESAVTFGEQVGDRHVRFERQLAEHRIGGVHRLDLDQRQAAIGRARHAAQRSDDGDIATRDAGRRSRRALPRAGTARRRRRRRAACGPRAPARH